MKILRTCNDFRLMSPEGDLLNGGGGDDGGQGGDDGGGAGAGGDDGGKGGSAYEALTLSEDWKTKHIPEDLRSDPSLKLVDNFENLVKGFVHAKKAVGADKVVKPSKHATPEEIMEFRQQLGAPQEGSGYELELPEDHALAADMVEGLKEQAAKLGVFPDQLKGIVNWYNEQSVAKQADYDKQIEADKGKALETLKKEWGQAFDAKVAKANQFIDKYVSDEQLKFIKEAGLGNEPHLIRLFANVFEKNHSEDDINSGDGGGSAKLTPGDADAKISAIFGDSKHPYHIKDHPGHDAAVKEVNDLFAMKG